MTHFSNRSWGPRMVGSREVATRLGVAHRTALLYLKEGTIPGAKQEGTLWQVPEPIFDTFLAEHTQTVVVIKKRGRKAG